MLGISAHTRTRCRWILPNLTPSTYSTGGLTHHRLRLVTNSLLLAQPVRCPKCGKFSHRGSHCRIYLQERSITQRRESPHNSPIRYFDTRSRHAGRLLRPAGPNGRSARWPRFARKGNRRACRISVAGSNRHAKLVDLIHQAVVSGYVPWFHRPWRVTTTTRRPAWIADVLIRTAARRW